MSARKSSHRTIFLIVSSGSPLALIASSLRPISKKPVCPMTRSFHPPMVHCNQRVRFAATWREEFFEVPSIRFWKRHHLSSRFVESRPGHTLWPQGLVGAMSRRDDLNAIAGIGHRHGLYASHLLDLERAGCQRSEQRAEGDPPAKRKSPGGRGRGRVVSKETVE